MARKPGTPLRRREVIGALALGGAAGAGMARAAAQSRTLGLSDLRKETEVACVYHCDFGNDQRYSQLLRNIHNHLSVYDFDAALAKIVIVAHGTGIKYHLKAFTGTQWERDPPLSGDFDKRMQALAGYGVEVYLCRLTFEAQRIDLSLAKDVPYIRVVPSGVAAIAVLQAKGFGYIKVG